MKKKECNIYDARIYVEFWFFKANKTARDGINDPHLFGSMYLDYNQTARRERSQLKHPPKSLTKDELFYAFEEYVVKRYDEEQREILKALSCATEDLNPLNDWLSALVGVSDELDLAVLAHWCWLVKRKSFGMPVRYHIMPVLFGPQGSGKTEALKALVSPYNDYLMSIKMDQLEDDRNYEGMSRNYIILFDELQSIERTDLNVLKHQITTDVNTYRKLHTHKVVNVKQNCSFIGATNKNLNESFSDSTGQRRFYELSVLEKGNWERVNSIDYRELWKGIDERREQGYLSGEILQQLFQAQKLLVNKEQVDLFIQEMNLEVTEGAREVSLASLYIEYQAWCISSGIRKPSDKSWFSKKLINRKINTKVIKINKRDVRYFYINKESAIREDGTLNSELRSKYEN